MNGHFTGEKSPVTRRIWKWLFEGNTGTFQEIGKACFTTARAAREPINLLRSVGLCHIGSWTRLATRGSPFQAYFQYGPGPDAPKELSKVYCNALQSKRAQQILGYLKAVPYYRTRRCSDIASDLGINIEYVRKLCRYLVPQGLIHIGSWDNRNGPRYRYGPGSNGNKPRPKKKTPDQAKHDRKARLEQRFGVEAAKSILNGKTSVLRIDDVVQYRKRPMKKKVDWVKTC